MSQYHIFGALELNGATLIPYTNINLDPALEKALFNTDARSGHSFTGIKTAGPMCSFSTLALKSVLDISGLNAASLTSSSAFSLYLIKHDAVGIASGSVHRKWTMTEGIIRLANISTANGHAEANFEVHGVDDGTNAVWVLAGSQALPTSPRVTDVWFQGPLYIGTNPSSTLYEVEQSTYTPNGEVLKRFSNGEVGPGFVAVKPPKPTLGVTAQDGILHNAAGAFGANVGPVTMFYREGAEGSGLRVSDATETHIKLTIASAFLTPDASSGTPGQEVGFSVMFDARDDGTNAVAALDTTAAIAEPS